MEKSGQGEDTVPASVPPPVFVIVNVFWGDENPTGIGSNVRLVGETEQAGCGGAVGCFFEQASPMRRAAATPREHSVRRMEDAPSKAGSSGITFLQSGRVPSLAPLLAGRSTART